MVEVDLQLDHEPVLGRRLPLLVIRLHGQLDRAAVPKVALLLCPARQVIRNLVDRPSVEREPAHQRLAVSVFSLHVHDAVKAVDLHAHLGVDAHVDGADGQAPHDAAGDDGDDETRRGGDQSHAPARPSRLPRLKGEQLTLIKDDDVIDLLADFVSEVGNPHEAPLLVERHGIARSALHDQVAHRPSPPPLPTILHRWPRMISNPLV